jgi:hypothetical protein
MQQRVIARPSSPGSVAFPYLRDGRKAHGRDGRTAKRLDGPAGTSSPRPVIRGESPPDELLAGIDGLRAHELPWLA